MLLEASYWDTDSQKLRIPVQVSSSYIRLRSRHFFWDTV